MEFVVFIVFYKHVSTSENDLGGKLKAPLGEHCVQNVERLSEQIDGENTGGKDQPGTLQVLQGPGRRTNTMPN